MFLVWKGVCDSRRCEAACSCALSCPHCSECFGRLDQLKTQLLESMLRPVECYIVTAWLLVTVNLCIISVTKLNEIQLEFIIASENFNCILMIYVTEIFVNGCFELAIVNIGENL